MINKRQEISDSLLYLISTSLSAILPIITIPIFTRILRPEDYGIYGLSMIYAIFMSGLANFGLSLAYERNHFQYSKSSEKQAQLLFSSLIFIITNFIILAVFTFIFRTNISQIMTNSPNNGILILTTFASQFILGTANNYYFIYLKNERLAKAYTKYKMSVTILYFILSLILVAYIKIGILGIAIAQLMSGATMFLYLSFSLLKRLPISFNHKILLESLKISYLLTPRVFIGVINTQFDKYMINLLSTVSGVGVYQIGKSVSELAFIFMTALQNVFNPKVYSILFEEKAKGGDSVGKYLTPFLYVSIFITLCISLFSREIVTILMPVDYHAAIPIITILSMYYGLMFFGKITSVQLIYMKKTGLTSILTILSVVVNVSLNIPLIIKYGAIGAAWATMLAGTISGTISFIVAQHYYRINYEWEKVGWIIGLFIFGSILTAFTITQDYPYILSLNIKITTLASYIYIGIKYRIISKDNILEVRNIMNPSQVTMS